MAIEANGKSHLFDVFWKLNVIYCKRQQVLNVFQLREPEINLQKKKKKKTGTQGDSGFYGN